ncbi:MAG TPA: DUF72 domain-containing protein [Opitutaceae bacterium]|nr:DUF72 domain-containing protein [Opitutaceae bacterium]
MAKRAGKIWIGTSGWVYKEWAEHFYPADWPKKDQFLFYVQRFPTVEINATFYRLPTPAMVRGWHKKAPAGFLFAVKGSRYITHVKRLAETEPALQEYFRLIDGLKTRLGPVLWQLPPSFRFSPENHDRLAGFLDLLPDRHRHAVEFRHPSWLQPDVFALLKKHGAAHVWLSSQRMPVDQTLTADFIYLRFHGLKDGPSHNYTTAELKPWARALADANRPAFVYFNNDLNTRAPFNALELMKLTPGSVAAFTGETG